MMIVVISEDVLFFVMMGEGGYNFVKQRYGTAL